MADQSLLKNLAVDSTYGTPRYFLNTGGAWRGVPNADVESMFGNGIAAKLQQLPESVPMGGNVSLQQGIKQLHDSQFNSLASSGWLDKFAQVIGTNTTDVGNYFQEQLAQGKSFQDIVQNNPYIDAQGLPKQGAPASTPYVPTGDNRPLALRSQGTGATTTSGTGSAPVGFSVDPTTGQFVQTGVSGSTTDGTDQFDGHDTTGWTDAAKQAYLDTKSHLNDKAANGQVVNPNVTVNADLTQKYLEQAQNELGPQFAQTLKQAQQDLKTAGERLAQDTATKVRDIGLQYGQNLEAAQQNYANRGLEFSSSRDKTEAQLATSAQNALDQTTQDALRSGQDIGQQGERLLGSTNMAGVPQQQIATGQSPIVGLAGQYGLGAATGSRNLFTPEGNTFGTMQGYQANAIESLKNDLVINKGAFGSAKLT